jgi:hypothetical protein
MKKLNLILIFTFVYCTTFSQSYFQQEVNTTINVSLNDKNNTLSAFEEIEYFNNSPDSLEYIFMHIWPNAYRNNGTDMAIQNDENGDVDFHFADSIDRGFIDSLDFKVDGEFVISAPDIDHIDIVALVLKSPLAPGEKINITTPFRVKIPLGIYSRLGHIGESYQITQWFPKPAVYDKDGWHPLPYLSQGEFYSEYGTYDVTITLPKNYVVGATGDLVNGEEEIAWLDNKVTETKLLLKEDKIGFWRKDGMDFPESSTELKTLHYHQENVHDFAWFADKRYYVLKGEVELPHSKNKVTTWAMFTNNEAKLWAKSIEYLNDATYYYSLWNGDYPYKHVTAVDGSISAGGGMEYPNITVIGESYSAFSLEQVIVHEVGHNWFYGILGSNERQHAWMDEGLNTFTENRYTETKYPEMDMGGIGLPKGIMAKSGLDVYGPRGMYDLGYLLNARRNYDQPIETTSENFTSMNYGAIVYGKTGIGMDYMLAYLGDTLFNKCMRAYFDKWKFKHPQPDDLRDVFQSVTGKDLSWFFDDYIKTTKKIDYKIAAIKKSETGEFKVTIKNKADISAPFALFGIKDDTLVVAKKWYEGNSDELIIDFKAEGADKIILDYNRDIPEIDRTDDVIKTSGLFKKARPLSIEFLGSIESRDKASLFYLPLLGWNSADGIMPGIALYNTTFPEKKLEWLVIPMYSTRLNNVNGVGQIHYNIYPNSIFRRFTIGAEFTAFGLDKTYNTAPYYTFSENIHLDQRLKVEGHIKTEIKSPLRKVKQLLSYRFVSTNESSKNTILQPNTYNILNYKVSNRQVLKPGSLDLQFLHGNPNLATNFSQLSLEAKLRLNYNIYLKGIDFRFFGGYTLQESNDFSNRYGWKLDGQNGDNDYLYDNVLLGRNDNHPSMLSQQTTNTHGAFKIPTSYSSNSWILSTNIKIESPVGPFGIFADAGLYPFTDVSNGAYSEEIGFLYDAGIYIHLPKDIFEIYIPLVYSKDITSELDYNNIDFLQRIRFMININQLNPFKMLREIKP